jgi:hypothetical protein
MVMNIVMLVLFVAQLLFVWLGSNYLKTLNIGLTLTGLLTAEQTPAILNPWTSKANQEYVKWNTWRTGAIISLIVTAALWWGFFIASEVPILLLAGASLSIGWSLTSAWGVDFYPDWTVEWHDKVIRIHDTITMNYIHERMAVIADRLQKRDNGEIELTSVEESTINYEVAKMAELIVSISRRNPDLID